MKKIAYFDTFSGISGDMILGAMVDAWLPLSHLKHTVRKLLPKGIHLRSRKVKRGHLAATKVDVLLSPPISRKPNNINSILTLIAKSALSPSIKQKSSLIFNRLAEAEGRAHGSSPEEVSFDELGGFDTIVDIVGAVAGLEYLEIDEVRASALNLGEGFIRMNHGQFPIPGPVTLHLLKNIPIYSNGIRRELTTPTGAAIISTLSVSFGSLPLFKPEIIGMGAGEAIIDESPNVLRLIIGLEDKPFLQDEVYQIETHIDDLNPQVYELLVENLLHDGALDVSLTPIIMKKGRPAILLTLLSPLEELSSLSERVFRETTTLGLRIQKVARSLLSRKEGRFQSSFGSIRIKSTIRGGRPKVSPEYEDCKRIAQTHKKPIRDILNQIETELSLTFKVEKSR
ncbi:MAG: nickel pincer cofactor biosynthesis protein LarC [Nitrospirae bacterium]|nr:nickel pincer cofactor biosynthesis protein LarC [Nitrospirota bacterium]